MSISEQISRIQLAKTNLRTSILNKGGTVASDALLGAYSTAVDNLPSGGQDLAYVSSYTLDDWGKPSSLTIKSGVTIIPNSEYKGLTSLSSVTLSDTVTTIGIESFRGCTGITDFYFGSGVTTIEQGALNECRSISSLTLPDSVTSIKPWAFKDCSGLTSINIPSGVTNIGTSGFANCVLLTSITIPSGITLIDTATFNNCRSLTSVTIPNSVTKIGQSAFQYCSGLTSIDIPNSVTVIDRGAFFVCSGITSVDIPNSVSTINIDAFRACSSLQYITIGSGVTSIGNQGFYGCSSLSSITCNAITCPTFGNNVFSGVSQTGVLYYPQGSDYSSFISKLPTGWTTVETRFVETGGQEVCVGYDKCKPMKLQDYVGGQWQDHVPSLIDYIPVEELTTECGFDESEYKMSAKLNDGSRVLIPFDGNSQLTSTNTSSAGGDKIVSLIIYNQVTSIGNSAFNRFYRLTSVTIPDSVTSIGQMAFNYCSGLTSVKLPSGLTTIESNTFANCSGLTSIDIPNGVTLLRQSAFDYCSSLSSITCNAIIAPTLAYYVFRGVAATGVLTIPQGSDYSTWLASLPTGWTVVEMQNEIYQWVDDGDNYICSGTTKYQRQKKQVSTDGGTTWTDVVPAEYQTGDLIETDSVDCGYVPTDYKAKVTLDDDSIVYIPSDGTSALTYYDVNQYANSAVEMEINSSITSVGGCAMMTGLTTLIIPNSVTDIDGEAFMDCTSLSSVTIPDSVTGMGDSAFFECSGLTSATIGSGVTQFNGWTFMNCTSLSSITSISSTAPTLGSMDFNNVASTGTLYTPNGGNYNAWMSALPNGWSKSSPLDNSKAKLILNDDSVVYIPLNGSSALTSGETSQYISTAVDVEIGSGVTGLSNAVFSGFTNLESIVIGDNVRTIGVSAFTWDSSLSSVTLGNSVTGLSDVAFGGCSGIQTITIPNSMRSIGNSCFDTCTSLTTITIPSGVTNMGVYCFHNCTSLSSITIGSGISTINNYMFCGDTSLSSITCERTTAPTVGDNVFNNLPTNGILNVPQGANYSSWLNRLPSGWSIPQTAQYRWVDYEVDPNNLGDNFPVYQVNTNDSNNLYSLEKQQVSTDGGTTWSDVSPLNTRFGNEISVPFPGNQVYVSGSFYAFDMTSEICEENTTQTCDDESYQSYIEGCGGDPDCEASINYEDFCYDSSEYTGGVTRGFDVYTSINNGSTWSVSTTSTYDFDPCACLGDCGEPENPEDPGASD